MKAALFILTILLSGCVSIELGSKKVERAKHVKLTAPTPPFEKTAALNVDAIWRNPKNGNAISYVSDCSDSSDPSLASIEQGVLSGIYPYSYDTQKDVEFEGRAGRRTRVRGVVDGVPSMVDLLIFKRNNCIYILSYVGLENFHTEDEGQFENFLRGFHAP